MLERTRFARESDHLVFLAELEECAMPTALVTGATGFVGSNLVARLRDDDWSVRCLIRNPQRASSLEQLGATLHEGNLNDCDRIEAAMPEVDYVFHVAGRVRALSEREFETDNVDGTRHVVTAAAAQATPPGVVLVSSLAAGGPNRPGQPRRESDHDQPISAYGRSKLSAERAAAQLADEVPISIIRPPIIFGPADMASLAIFTGIKRIRLHAVPGFRKFPVSLVHVADLCDAMLRIAQGGSRVRTPNGSKLEQANVNQGVYYIGAERSIPYGELGKLAAQAIGCSGFMLPVPRPLFWLAGGAAELYAQVVRKPTVLNLDKVREAVAPAWECDDQRLRQELDYQPAAPLEDRFAETANWYREHGWL